MTFFKKKKLKLYFSISTGVSSLHFNFVYHDLKWGFEEKIFSLWKFCKKYEKKYYKILIFPEGIIFSELSCPLGDCLGHAEIDFPASEQCDWKVLL